MKRGAILFAALVVLAPLSAGTAALAADEQETVTIEIKVVNGDGSAVEGATLNVSWNGGQTTARTFSNGRAFAEVPADASVTIAATHDTYVRNVPVEVENPTQDQVVEVPMAQPASIELVVVDGDGPVSGARVALSKVGQSGLVAYERTDDEGAVRATQVEEGEYTATVRKSGFRSTTQRVQVSGDATAEVRIVSDNVDVSFAVQDDHFDPPRRLQATVTAYDDEGQVASVRAKRNVESAVTLPVNAEYTVVVEREGYGETEFELRVDEDPTSVTYNVSRVPELSLRTAQTKVVVGQPLEVNVTDEYGDPVEGARIHVGGERTDATTGEDGLATVRIQSTGDVEIRATQGDLSTSVTITGVATGTGTTAPPGTTAGTAPPTGGGTTVGPSTATSDTPGDDDEGSPGFTAGLALIALAAGVVALARRR